MNKNIKVDKELTNMLIIMENDNLDYKNVNHLALAWSGACQKESDFCDRRLYLGGFTNNNLIRFVKNDYDNEKYNREKTLILDNIINTTDEYILNDWDKFIIWLKDKRDDNKHYCWVHTDGWNFFIEM